MTTEELWAAREEAEKGIYRILADLAQKTGLTPVSVDFGLIDFYGESRFMTAVGHVTVRLELR